jgi:hypothetical protein
MTRIYGGFRSGLVSSGLVDKLRGRALLPSESPPTEMAGLVRPKALRKILKNPPELLLFLACLRKQTATLSFAAKSQFAEQSIRILLSKGVHGTSYNCLV